MVNGVADSEGLRARKEAGRKPTGEPHTVNQSSLPSALEVRSVGELRHELLDRSIRSTSGVKVQSVVSGV